jgi:hypothetical protein
MTTKQSPKGIDIYTISRELRNNGGHWTLLMMTLIQFVFFECSHVG